MFLNMFRQGIIISASMNYESFLVFGAFIYHKKHNFLFFGN